MLNLLSIIVVGFVLGMRHATDPDHVIAVTTIVSNQKKISRAALTGAFWGIGHTLTILVVGSLIIVCGVVVPARIGLSMEFSVAVMLVILGVMNVVAFVRSPRSLSKVDDAAVVHSHSHNHGDHAHTHAHAHSLESDSHSAGAPISRMDRLFGSFALYRHARPLLVGIVHGLAGSAAVALLVLTTIRDPRWAVAYLLLFGLGTVAGMMLITMSIASALSFFGRNHASLSGRLGFASGLISLTFGFVLVYQIGIVGGLFTANPQWIPR